MENKYYVPEIEEFCVGFEYEKLLIGSKDGKDAHEWLPTIWNPLHGLNTDNTKVKYLDKEDIESLGLKHTGGQMLSGARADYEMLTNVTGKVILQHTHYNQKLVIKLPNFIRDGSGNFNGYMVLFDGYVKNKSELKRVLKMLNIK